MSRKREKTSTVENAMADAVKQDAATSSQPMTLEAVRNELKAVKGKKLWRSIDELANTPEFQAAVEKEFPSAAQEWVDPVSRRGFLKLMGASMALAGMAGCTKQPAEAIYPYVKAPEDLVLGKPMYFATAHPMPVGATPLLVKSSEFRPIKVDGNPEHPYNAGSSDVFAQGSLLALYDPDRSQKVLYHGENRSWGEFVEAFQQKVASSKDGTGIYFLSATITSPTLARQWKAVQAAYPKATLAQYDPAIAGTVAEKGINVQYDLSAAPILVSLDADFISSASYPGFHKLVRDYAFGRKQPEKGMNRLYAIESSTTTTGMKAEHRLGLRASEIPAFAAELAKAVGVAGVNPPAYAWTGEQQTVSRRAGQGSEGQCRQERGDSRPLSASRGCGAGDGHQQHARQYRQDGLCHRRDGEPAALRSAWRSQEPGGRPECGQSGLAGDSRMSIRCTRRPPISIS